MAQFFSSAYYMTSSATRYVRMADDVLVAVRKNRDLSVLKVFLRLKCENVHGVLDKGSLTKISQSSGDFSPATFWNVIKKLKQYNLISYNEKQQLQLKSNDAFAAHYGVDAYTCKITKIPCSMILKGYGIEFMERVAIKRNFAKQRGSILGRQRSNVDINKKHGISTHKDLQRDQYQSNGDLERGVGINRNDQVDVGLLQKSLLRDQAVELCVDVDNCCQSEPLSNAVTSDLNLDINCSLKTYQRILGVSSPTNARKRLTALEQLQWIKVEKRTIQVERFNETWNVLYPKDSSNLKCRLKPGLFVGLEKYIVFNEKVRSMDFSIITNKVVLRNLCNNVIFI